ncbi:MAG: hypothetical protein LBV49_04170 [Azonexus sp.]|jgi:hypothetical protein|nr:hypothetical protein [Azonexus sp.]
MSASGGSAWPGGEMWLTPNVPNGGRSVPPEVVAAKGMTANGKRTVGLESQTRFWMTPSVSNASGNQYTRDRGQPGAERATLTGQATAWATPRATDGEKGGPNCRGGRGDPILAGQAAQWSTPNAHDGRRPGADLKSTQGGNLSCDAVLWPKPAARDAKGANSTGHITSNDTGRKHLDQLANFVAYRFSLPLAPPTRDGAKSLPSDPNSRRLLNPIFDSWLMGWPSTWVIAEPRACGALETASWRRALQQRLSSLCDGREPEREAA